MPDNILISICITTYNMEKYVERAIDSVLMQKVNFAYEIIVADDCSADNTIRILQSYQQKIGENFKIIYAENNKGIVENFSNALKNSRGKYIASLDADDHWTDEYKLQAQLEVLENNESLDFVYTNYYYVPEDESYKVPAYKKHYEYPGENLYEEYLLRPFLCPSTMFFKRSIIDFSLIDLFVQRKFFSQDYSLFLDFCMRRKGSFLNRFTTNYTLRKNSLSRQSDIQKKLDYFVSCHEIGNFFLEKKSINKEESAKREFNFHFKLLLTSWASNDFRLVKKYNKHLSAKQFLQYNPKALYIHIASKNKILYQIFKPILLRKRKLW